MRICTSWATTHEEVDQLNPVVVKPFANLSLRHRFAMPPPSSEGGFLEVSSDEGAGRRRREYEGKTSPQTRRLLLPYRLAFHIHELVDRRLPRIMRLGVFGAIFRPIRRARPDVQCTNPCVGASRAASRTGNNDSSMSANWLAADSSDARSITGTNPHAIASITLTDSMSAIEQCTNKSPERNNVGHIGVLVESDIGLARQQTPGAELEILLERPSTGDHQLNIAGVPGHRHRLDQRTTFSR